MGDWKGTELIKKHEFTFISEYDGRLDKVASSSLSLPRSIFSLDSFVVTINGKNGKKSSQVKVGDNIGLEYEENILEGIKAEELPLDILYEDDDILVINKKQGMVVHPAEGNYSGTLVNALLYRYGEDFLKEDEENLRPGIVHRLDKDTSGVMVIAKSRIALSNLSQEFLEHKNEKYYAALVKGFFPNNEGVIEKRIVRDRDNRKRFTVTDNKTEGKDAVTKYRVINQNRDYAFLRIRIYTGRTHQIRVHMKSINHPILGDPIYSRPDNKYRNCTLMLHAERIVITHPVSKERMVFRSPLPERFNQILESEGL